MIIAEITRQFAPRGLVMLSMSSCCSRPHTSAAVSSLLLAGLIVPQPLGVPVSPLTTCLPLEAALSARGWVCEQQLRLVTAKMDEKVLVFLTFLSSCLALALLSGSLATDHWVTAEATRASNSKSHGSVNFGLFFGTRRLNHGFGERIYDMNVFQVQYRESQFMVRELYITTIACVAGAILVGVVGACIALYNVAANPSEALCQYPGE